MTPHPHQETADGFTGPLKAELPLDYLEAFRLASFGIEYQPVYGVFTYDAHGVANRFYRMSGLRLEDSIYTLSTGRTFYANHGIVGMCPEFAQGVNGYEGVFAEGYDGHEYTRKGYAEDPTREWTPAERQELADHACRLWQQWAQHQPAPRPTDEDLAAESAQRLATANRALQSAK